jgi:hypothetical protein
MLTEEVREAIVRFDRARKADPEWDKQVIEQLHSTMQCILRNYPFSWLLPENILRSRENA